MHLSSRLRTIASMIPENITVVDIGCDHALLDIYLTQKNTNRCIATDVNSNVLAIAKKNIETYSLKQEITLIQSDGFQQVEVVEPSIAVIAGMGTSTILSILKNPKAYQFQFVLIQTNNEWEYLRKKVSKMGFHIVEEKNILDKNKYYVLMKWAKGRKHYTKKQCFLGPILMHQSNQDYYQHLLKIYQRNYQKVPKHYFKKRYDIYRRIHWLKKELKG